MLYKTETYLSNKGEIRGKCISKGIENMGFL